MGGEKSSERRIRDRVGERAPFDGAIARGGQPEAARLQPFFYVPARATRRCCRRRGRGSTVCKRCRQRCCCRCGQVGVRRGKHTGWTAAASELTRESALCPITCLVGHMEATTFAGQIDRKATPPVREAEPIASAEPGLPPPSNALPAPVGGSTVRIRDWFDDAAEALIPTFDGTLATARAAATAYARHAKADNTRRAYRAGVRAWCAWCDRHGLPALPARAADVVAFLAAERGRGAFGQHRRAARAPPSAICISSPAARCPPPRPRSPRRWPASAAPPARPATGRCKKLAATIGLLRELLAPIPEDLRGLARPRPAPGRFRRCAAARRTCRNAPRASRDHRARPAPRPAPLQGRSQRARRDGGHPLWQHRSVPGARAADLGQSRRHHRGAGVPAALAATARGRSRPAAAPRSAGRHSIRAASPGSSSARARAAGFDGTAGAATASSAAR